MSKMTKQEALRKIEELKKYVENEETTSEKLVCETFSTKGGKTGVVVTFPDSVKNPVLPVLEYMAREFVALGGKAYNLDWRLDTWRTMRFSINAPLHTLWKGSTEKTYKALPEQPTVGDLLGKTFFFLVDTSRDVAEHAGLSFNDLMEKDVNVISPIGWLGLLIATAEPADTSTYLSYENWEWIGAITETYAASGDSDSGGLHLNWGDPGSSGVDNRARSVLA